MVNPNDVWLCTFHTERKSRTDDHHFERKNPAGLPAGFGREESGADGDRTRNLSIANAALSQLSYGPSNWE